MMILLAAMKVHIGPVFRLWFLLRPAEWIPRRPSFLLILDSSRFIGSSQHGFLCRLALLKSGCPVGSRRHTGKTKTGPINKDGCSGRNGYGAAWRLLWKQKNWCGLRTPGGSIGWCPLSVSFARRRHIFVRKNSPWTGNCSKLKAEKNCTKFKLNRCAASETSKLFVVVARTDPGL